MKDDARRALAGCRTNCLLMSVQTSYAKDLDDIELYTESQRFSRKSFSEAGKARTGVARLKHTYSSSLIGQQAQQRLIA